MVRKGNEKSPGKQRLKKIEWMRQHEKTALHTSCGSDAGWYLCRMPQQGHRSRGIL